MDHSLIRTELPQWIQKGSNEVTNILSLSLILNILGDWYYFTYLTPLDLKYVYGWNHYTMRFMGLWPAERRWKDPSSYIVLTPLLMMLFFICGPQTANLPTVAHDFYLLVENLSMGNITITISFLKTIAFWVNGKPLKSLLERMAEDWGNEVRPIHRETMKEIGRVTRVTIIRSTVMCHCVVIAYVVLRFSTAKYNDSKLLFRAYFPYDTDASPSAELTSFAQIVAAMYAATSYTAVDTFIAMLVLHVCGQLSILKADLRDLESAGKADLQANLGRIVRKHEYLNVFAETIEKCFNTMLLLQMVGCTIQLCFQCVQVIMSTGEEANQFLIMQISFLLLYVIYVILQLYLYCYVGERLLVESTEIAEAAYGCEWYNLSAKEAKLLIIVIRRARLPLQITAGKFCSLNLVLYAQILKTSMGYISVLCATKNK